MQLYCKPPFCEFCLLFFICKLKKLGICLEIVFTYDWSVSALFIYSKKEMFFIWTLLWWCILIKALTVAWRLSWEWMQYIRVRGTCCLCVSVQRTFRYFFKLVWGYVGSWQTWKTERMCALLCTICEWSWTKLLHLVCLMITVVVEVGLYHQQLHFHVLYLLLLSKLMQLTRKSCNP